MLTCCYFYGIFLIKTQQRVEECFSQILKRYLINEETDFWFLPRNNTHKELPPVTKFIGKVMPKIKSKYKQ